MPHYLVVAHQTADSPELLRHVSKVLREQPDSEFSILVPLTPVSHRFTWDDDETTALARENADRARQLLEQAGATIRRTALGGRVPIDALDDELRLHDDYDEIIISTLPPGISRWLKLDFVSQARKRFGLPVTHVVAQPSQTAARTPEREAVATGARSNAAAPSMEMPRASSSSQTMAPRERELPPGPVEPSPVEDQRDELGPIAEALAGQPALRDAYIRLAEALRETSLDQQMRELAILRGAFLQRSEYVWDHHVRAAHAVGVPGDAIHACRTWESTEIYRFDPRQRQMFAYVDALQRGGQDARSAEQKLAEHMPREAIIALTMTVGFYRTLAVLVDALDVKLPGRFVGWDTF